MYPELHSLGRPVAWHGWSGTAEAPHRTRFDAANHFLTGYLDIPGTVRAVKAGAADVLIKPVSSTELLRAIEAAIAHHDVALTLKIKLDMVRAHVAALTPRERQVFDLVVCGKANKQVARALGCTERTIKAHRHMVMEKMQARTLSELVLLAVRIGVRAIAERTA